MRQYIRRYMYEVLPEDWEGSTEQRWADSRNTVSFDSPLGSRYTLGNVYGKYVVIYHSLWQSDWEDNFPIEVHVMGRSAAIKMCGLHAVKIADKRAIK